MPAIEGLMPGMDIPAAVSTLIQYCAIGGLTTWFCASAHAGMRASSRQVRRIALLREVLGG